MPSTIDKLDPTGERIVSEAMSLSDAQKRRIAIVLLKSVGDWPNSREEELLEKASPAEKQAALETALDEGLSELDAGKGIEGTPSELLSRIDDELGMRRNGAG
jgi:hypothetical protein